jgi:hypothetical protein
MDPKKRQVGASERDEFLSAAWRVLVAKKIDAERLVFVVDEMGSNTSRWRPCRPGRGAEIARAGRCLPTAARTPHSWRA